MKVRIASIAHDSIVDGPGLRCVVYAQGCLRCCPNCHNPETHSLEGGFERDVEEIWAEIEKNKLAQGITISGGEPFLQPEAFAALAERAKKAGLDVWVYTGYTYEELLSVKGAAELLKYTDVLVDGPYMEEKKADDGEPRGSTNQRIIKRECGKLSG